jgi:hypothetical protein
MRSHEQKHKFKCACVQTYEFVCVQGKELLNQLKEVLAHLPVEVLIGKSFVKVRHQVQALNA